MSGRPFRFGVIAERFSSAGARRELAQKAETLGYDTLLIRDHFVEEPFGHQFAPFSALASAAAVTSTLRLGTLVIDNDYRHPAVLAKEAATLDLLSDGRFELGIGAGWLSEEYRRAGIPLDSAGTRISRLAEALPILRSLINGNEVTFAGDHYTLDALPAYPAAKQQPVPLLVGGGSPRILRLAGATADIVGILTTSVSSGVAVKVPEGRRSAAVRQRVEWIREGAGNRFDTIELSMIPTVILTDDSGAALDRYIESQGWNDVDREAVRDMPS
ncbi:MAG: TIGR03621 family F420-dependent LLM class oxidoreductase, partial [Thermomicrobiales bacterium]